MRSADALAPVAASQVAVSLALFVAVYVAVFSIGIRYIHRLIERGPEPAVIAPPAGAEGLPNRPLSLGHAAEPPR